MFNRKTLEGWLRRQVLKEHDGGRCVRLVINHLVSGKIGTEVLRVRVPKKGVDDGWVEDQIQDFEQSVADDAGGLGGLQKYAVFAYVEELQKPIARFTFSEQGTQEDAEDSEGGIDSEPPTKSGLTAQLMRHTEASHRTSVSATGHIIMHLQRMLAKQADTIERLTEKHLEVITNAEMLLSQKHERDLETRRAELKEKMTGELFDKVNLLLPTVVNRLGGKKLLPEKASAQTQVLKSIMESMSEEQVSALQGILKPEQLMAILDLMQRTQEPEKEDQSAPN